MQYQHITFYIHRRMTNKKTIFKTQLTSKAFFLIITVILLLPHNAYAYIDLGSGSLLVQFLLAGFFGFIFVIKSYFNRIKMFLLSIIRKKDHNGIIGNIQFIQLIQNMFNALIDMFNHCSINRIIDTGFRCKFVFVFLYQFFSCL